MGQKVATRYRVPILECLAALVTGCDRAGFTFARSAGARGDQNVSCRIRMRLSQYEGMASTRMAGLGLD